LSPTLEDAIALASQAHRGQVDKAGKPYILHPLRVMLRQEAEAAQIVAVLHDVLEDTGVTLEGLRAAGYRPEICEAVDCLTRRPDEPYDIMISRVAANPLARAVKLADLEDNMDPRRRLDGEPEVQRQIVYGQARASLLAVS
jgi:(p)ppGpp synthase/HD superfamily hydrolase